MLPQRMKGKILYACHVEPAAGHLGKNRTIHRIKERFMWHGIVKDVMEMVGTNFLYAPVNLLLYRSKLVMSASELTENLPLAFYNLIQCL